MNADYDLSIHQNPDAMAWAKLFIETYEKLGKPEVELDWIHVWFCNVMMAMHDHLHPERAPIVMPDGSAFFTATIKGEQP